MPSTEPTEACADHSSNHITFLQPQTGKSAAFAGTDEAAPRPYIVLGIRAKLSSQPSITFAPQNPTANTQPPKADGR
ncbi:MAG: hypothetical protein KJ065_27455 [Anaerolineae bacterium]|nr:hypothetical protein [Anaerolineae bacterium]